MTARADDTLLTLDGVTKAYRRRRVLTGVDLRLRRGQLVAVVGENGAGKSTLLRITVGLLAADAGRVTRRGRLGYCPQESLLFDRLTVGENFRYFARAYGMENGHDRRRALLEQLGFAQYEDHLVTEVSGGTRQKLNLCLALLHDPDLLVLDEPYAGFDWETYRHFWDLSVALRERGRGLLVVSHLIYDRDRFDAVYELRDGGLRCVHAT